MCESKCDQVRWRAFQKTGCLITANGEDDDEIKPEGLSNYVVPSPSISDPTDYVPQPNDVGNIAVDTSNQDDHTEDVEIDDLEIDDLHVVITPTFIDENNVIIFMKTTVFYR